MTAEDPVASKAEEPFVLLGKGDSEQTVAVPSDQPTTAEPADKQDKTVAATHAATFEAALKEAAPDAPPTVGDAAAALKDATLRELGAAREKASFKIKAAARAARQNALAWRRVGRWALGLLALAFVFAGGFFLGDRRGRVASAPTQVSKATTPAANDAPVAETVKPTPPTAPTGSPTCRTRPPVDSLFDGVVNDILGLRAPRPRRAEPLDAFVRRMLSPAPRVVPTMDVSFGWPGLELTVPFLQDQRAARDRAVRQEQQRRLDAAVAARHQAAQVQQRRLQEQRRLEHARHKAAHNRQALEEQRRLERARHEAARRQAQKAAAVKDLEERLAKAEAARDERLRLTEQRTTDVVETTAVDTEPAVEPAPAPVDAESAAEPLVEPTRAPTRPARDALRELSIKQLRNILAARGGAPCTTCKEKDDLVAAVMAVLDD